MSQDRRSPAWGLVRDNVLGASARMHVNNGDHSSVAAVQPCRRRCVVLAAWRNLRLLLHAVPLHLLACPRQEI